MNEACPLCGRITHASDCNDDGVCTRCLGPRAIAPSTAGKPNALLFQRDQNWWAIWTPEGDAVPFEDAYPALDDHDEPRAAILVDIFARLNDGVPFPIYIVHAGLQIGANGWPIETALETVSVGACGLVGCSNVHPAHGPMRVVDKTSNLDAADVVGGELVAHGAMS